MGTKFKKKVDDKLLIIISFQKRAEFVMVLVALPFDGGKSL